MGTLNGRRPFGWTDAAVAAIPPGHYTGEQLAEALARVVPGTVLYDDGHFTYTKQPPSRLELLLGDE